MLKSLLFTVGFLRFRKNARDIKELIFPGCVSLIYCRIIILFTNRLPSENKTALYRPASNLEISIEEAPWFSCV
ncbi:MAG: hypothetical protein ACI8Q1_000220, partial [Parvicella sp.]